MATFLLRVWLPDRPGALGSVASRVGAVGGDVIGIDILEREEGRAVDELVVELPTTDLVGLTVREVGQVAGDEGEDVRSVVALARMVDSRRRDLDRIRSRGEHPSAVGQSAGQSLAQVRALSTARSQRS